MKNDRPKASVLTLGCRVNQYESEAIEAELQALGFEVAVPSEVCDVYIINTCAVTGESERKSRQMIRRAATKNKTAAVIVTGCYSQLHENEAAALPNVRYVCGTRNKRTAAQVAASLIFEGEAGGDARICVPNAENVSAVEVLPVPKTRRTRAYVKIEDGCDNHCTYCIIRKARGKVASRDPEEVLEEIQQIAAGDCHEVVLTGIETASYGKDNGASLTSLMLAAAKVDGIERVRLGSLEPSALNKAFCDAVASEKKIMPSFHLSLQSGSDRILAAMKRRYNREQVLANVNYLRSLLPNVTFTCDIIVGFPDEREEDFLDTVDIARKIGFLHMHIFPFSPREGTPAAEMPCQLPEAVKSERLHRLEAVGQEIARSLYDKAVGERKTVLFETYKNGYLFGHTEEMTEVKTAGDRSLVGTICPAYITGREGEMLLACIEK